MPRVLPSFFDTVGKYILSSKPERRVGRRPHGIRSVRDHVLVQMARQGDEKALREVKRRIKNGRHINGLNKHEPQARKVGQARPTDKTICMMPPSCWQ